MDPETMTPDAQLDLYAKTLPTLYSSWEQQPTLTPAIVEAGIACIGETPIAEAYQDLARKNLQGLADAAQWGGIPEMAESFDDLIRALHGLLLIGQNSARLAAIAAAEEAAGIPPEETP